MKIKTADLIGPALDWAVAKCEGDDEEVFRLFYNPSEPSDYDVHGYPEFHYSTDWSQGGPIIERLMLQEGLVLRCWVERSQCQASLDFPYRFSNGPTPLIAAMRCFVASKLGDEVDVPEELLT